MADEAVEVTVDIQVELIRRGRWPEAVSECEFIARELPAVKFEVDVLKGWIASCAAHIEGPWLDCVLGAMAAQKDRFGTEMHNGPPEGLCGQLLVGVAGRLYGVNSDGSVLEQTEIAIGAARFYAMGALFATRDRPGTARVQAALEAALEFSPVVFGPVDILELAS